MKEWCLEVWGDYACFTRPEMKVERVSYDVITPSAARAIFESILWKPAIRWHILRIDILNQIKWVSVRRNEVGRIATAPSQAQIEGNAPIPEGIFIEKERQQRAGLFLKDVRYRLYAQIEFIPPEQRKKTLMQYPEVWADSSEESEFSSRYDEKIEKYLAMFERRAKKGQCFHRPYFGCREFPCNFKLIEDAQYTSRVPKIDKRELGWMLYDMDFSDVNNPKPMFYNAVIVNDSIITDRSRIEVRK